MLHTKMNRRAALGSLATLTTGSLLALAAGCNQKDNGTSTTSTTNTANRSGREMLTVGYLPVT